MLFNTLRKILCRHMLPCGKMCPVNRRMVCAVNAKIIECQKSQKRFQCRFVSAAKDISCDSLEARLPSIPKPALILFVAI